MFKVCKLSTNNIEDVDLQGFKKLMMMLTHRDFRENELYIIVSLF